MLALGTRYANVSIMATLPFWSITFQRMSPSPSTVLVEPMPVMADFFSVKVIKSSRNGDREREAPESTTIGTERWSWWLRNMHVGDNDEVEGEGSTLLYNIGWSFAHSELAAVTEVREAEFKNNEDMWWRPMTSRCWRKVSNWHDGREDSEGTVGVEGIEGDL